MGSLAAHRALAVKGRLKQAETLLDQRLGVAQQNLALPPDQLVKADAEEISDLDQRIQ